MIDNYDKKRAGMRRYAGFPQVRMLDLRKSSTFNIRQQRTALVHGK